MVGKMSVWGNVLVGKCPVKKASFREVSSWVIVRWGSIGRGFVLGEVSVGEVSRQETALQSILVTSRNSDRKIKQSIRITSRPPTRKSEAS